MSVSLSPAASSCLLLATAIAFLLMGIMTEPAVAQPADCNWERNEFLTRLSYDEANKSRVELTGQSAEGGEANLYKKRGKVVKIEVVLYGETGKLEATYYVTETASIYLVEMTDYYYAAPISADGVEISAVSSRKFVLCNGGSANYPGNSEMGDAVRRSATILEEILRRQ